MNQRIENELNSILEELENLGHCKNDLISHCLKQDGIQIARRWDVRRVVILGMLIVGMSYLFFFNELGFCQRSGDYSRARSPGKDNTLCYPAQVQIKNGKSLERWHWDFGQYGDLNGFIQRYTCNTDVDPLSVTCSGKGKSSRNTIRILSRYPSQLFGRGLRTPVFAMVWWMSKVVIMAFGFSF